ncbi:MAG: hypothetical protein KKF67_03160, partial [Nanoarchaeota archaeon]|nr:hypothetical protein [Nanoarchaeota archaeon]
ETTEEGKITLWVNRGRFADEEIEYSVTISPDTTEGDFDVYYLSSGDKADIIIKEFAGAREEKLSILLGDISYNSANPDESIVSLIVGYTGTRTRPLIMNSYCDIDGRVKGQKTVNLQGDWASCQNNYECDSNLCSSGECIEIQKMLKEVSAFKSLGVRVLCKLAHLLNEDNYSTCIYNFLGEE